MRIKSNLLRSRVFAAMPCDWAVVLNPFLGLYLILNLILEELLFSKTYFLFSLQKQLPFSKLNFASRLTD